MPFLVAAVSKDLRRWRQDWPSLAIWLGIPLLVGTLITALVGDGGKPPRATLLVVDRDGSAASRTLSAALAQSGVLELERVDASTAAERIAQGDASAVLHVPERFGSAWLERAPATLRLETNPAESILPLVAEASVRIALDASFYLRETFEREIDGIAALVAERAAVDAGTGADARGTSTAPAMASAALAADTTGRLTALAARLFPPQVELHVLDDGGAGDTSLALLFVPGVLVMAVVFSAQGLASDLWGERELGTLERLRGTPQGAARVLLAKLVTAAIVLGAIVALALAVAALYHDLAPPKLLSLLLWATLGGIVLYLGFAVLTLLAPSRHAATLIASMVMFPALMAGGSFFPLQSMPSALASWGRWLPNGVLVERATAELLAPHAFSIPIAAWLAALAAAAVLFALSVRLLGESFGAR